MHPVIERTGEDDLVPRQLDLLRDAADDCLDKLKALLLALRLGEVIEFEVSLTAPLIPRTKLMRSPPLTKRQKRSQVTAVW